MGGLFGGTARQHSRNQPSWYGQMIPQYREALGLGQQAYAPGGQLPGYSPDFNLQLAPFNETQQQAFGQLLDQSQYAQQLAGTGGQNIQATLGGAYLDPATNPWLASTYQYASQPLVNQFQLATMPSLMAQAGRSGALGGSAFNEMASNAQYNLGQALGKTASDIYGGNYERERQNQIYAMQMTPGMIAAQFAPGQQTLQVGTLQQQQDQLANEIARQNALQQVQWDPQWAQQYAQFLGLLSPGSTVFGYQKDRQEPFWNT